MDIILIASLYLYYRLIEYCDNLLIFSGILILREIFMTLSIEYFTLSLTDVTNKYVALSGTPTSPSNVALDVVNSTAQAILSDFGVDGTKIAWDNTSLNLYSLLDSTNDQLRVIYDKSSI